MLQYNYSYTEGKSLWAHCIVTSNFVSNNKSFPLQFQSNYRNENCKALGKKFISKMSNLIYLYFCLPKNKKRQDKLTPSLIKINSSLLITNLI